MSRRIHELREKLSLSNYTPFYDIDPDLLLLATTSREKINSNPTDVRSRLIEKYGSVSREYLEFIGDSIYNTIILVNIYEKFPRLGVASAIRQELISNNNLNRYFRNKFLCFAEDDVKGCADALEAIVGALFVHGFKKYSYDIMGAIELWLDDMFHIKEDIEYILQGNSVIKGNREGGWSEWSNWTPCINGKTYSYRFCSNPYPDVNGKKCSGKNYISKDCEVQNLEDD